MDILYNILKVIVILGANIGFGCVISYCFHFYLFYPKKIYIWKYHFYFSPGLVFRKKNQLIMYLHLKIDEYIKYTNKDYFHKNYLTRYEDKLHRELFNYIINILNIEWMPNIIKKNIERQVSQLTWFFIYKFSRTIIPNMIKDLNINQKIDKIDLIVDVYKLRKIFEEHFFYFILNFNILFFTLVGIVNVLLFFLLK